MQVHIFRPDLLGARILNLAYGAAFARLAGCPFQIHWPTFHKFAAQSGYALEDGLEDLFEPSDLPDYLGSLGGRLSGDRFDAGADRGADLIHTIKAGSARGGSLSLNDIMSADADVIFSHVEPLSIAGISRPSWHGLARQILLELPDRPEIRDGLASISALLPTGRIMAIHIRRGDVVHDFMNQTAESISANKHLKFLSNFLMRFVPLSIYRAHLRTRKFDAVMLFSDDLDIDKSLFEDIVPTVNVTSLVQQLELTKMQRDFIEIRCMSKANELLASRSRFSQLAALYAGSDAIDLSRSGETRDYLLELDQRYGLKSSHPIFSVLEKALDQRR